jgi:hypothetical protein
MELDKHREEVTAYYSGREHKPFRYIVVDEAHDLVRRLKARQQSQRHLIHCWKSFGIRHEKNYIEHLTETGLDVVRINGVDVAESAVSETFTAMPVIAQGALAHQGWGGRADILRRIEL